MEVHYELYDGLPLMAKWLTVRNNSAQPVTPRFAPRRAARHRRARIHRGRPAGQFPRHLPRPGCLQRLLLRRQHDARTPTPRPFIGGVIRFTKPRSITTSNPRACWNAPRPSGPQVQIAAGRESSSPSASSSWSTTARTASAAAWPCAAPIARSRPGRRKTPSSCMSAAPSPTPSRPPLTNAPRSDSRWSS